MPEGSDDLAQPDDGQGGSPYADYLQRIPEDARGEAEEAFKAFDANTTRKFQDAAEYRKQWEPLEKLGVQNRDTAEVEWAMQFVDALQNPAAIKDWYDGYAQQHNLTPAQQAQQSQADLEGEYVDPTVTSQMEKLLQSQLGPVASQLAELTQWQQAQESQAREAQAKSQIDSEITDLKAKHSDFNEQLVEKLLPQYLQSDPKNAVQRAFADSQAIQAQIEQAAIQGKVNQPAGAMSGGQPNGTPDQPPKGEALAWAAKQALEQLRGNRQ